MADQRPLRSGLTGRHALALAAGLLLAALCSTSAQTVAEPAAPEGAAYYVAPDGDDSAPGTEASPWRTIGRAAAALAAGDTAYLMTGTYAERVIVVSSGEEGRPITLAAAPGQSPVISGTEGRRVGGQVEVRAVAHVRLVGLTVQDVRGCGIVVTDAEDVTIERCHTRNTAFSGIRIINSRRVLVDGCEVEGACQLGGEESVTIKLNSDGVEVRGCHIHDTGHEGVDVKEGARNVLVRGNHLHHVERQGLYADAWNLPTYNIEFSGNTVHDCGFGIAAGSEMGGLLSNVRILNNIVYANQGPGIIVADWGGETPHPVEGVLIVNNTVVGNGQARTEEPWGGGVCFENAEATGVVVRNNILSGNRPWQIVAEKVPAGATVERNLLQGDADVTGQDVLTGDPAFVDAASGDFHLRVDSPAIDAGLPDGAPATDFEGDLRPCGAAPDIGADEFCPPLHGEGDAPRFRHTAQLCAATAQGAGEPRRLNWGASPARGSAATIS